ncbi:MAG TPA: porin family protein [Deltaproteobacteria bacterium]|nr:porin family protein [Deltaproteobacteria bacterium]
MKKVIYAVFVVLMMFAFSSLAHAQSGTKGIYVGLVGGYVVANDVDGKLSYGPASLISTNSGISLVSGYLVGAKVGWLTPFTNRILALELEYNHIEQKMDSWDNWVATPGFAAGLDGKIKIDLLMFNMIARYPEGRFHPYVGAGAGAAYAKIGDTSFISLRGYEGVAGGGSDTVFAYQLMAGLDFDITENIILGAGYKYLVADKVQYDSFSAEMWGRGSMQADYKGHNIMLSLSYMF